VKVMIHIDFGRWSGVGGRVLLVIIGVCWYVILGRYGDMLVLVSIRMYHFPSKIS